MLATRVARGPDPRQLAFWFNACGCLLCLPPGLVLLGSAHVSLGDALWLTLAGVGTAATIRLMAFAFERGRLGVVGPLMSLEGAVTAMLALAVAGQMPGVVLSGIAISVLGSVAVAFGAARRGHLPGAPHALLAAACAGVVLWALAHQSQSPFVALMVARAVGAAVLVPTISRWRMPRDGRWRIPNNIRWLLTLAAFDVAGNTMFMLGSKAGSVPATAIMAAQFGTLTALAGVWRLKETLTGLQVIGLLILGAGVAAIAAGG